MVNWDEIQKELKKLSPERALEYLKYLQKTLKDKEILTKINEEIEQVEDLIKQAKNWKKTAVITPISRNVRNELEEMSRAKPIRQELNLENAVEIIEKDLNPKENGVKYGAGGTDYGTYLSEKLSIDYEKPGQNYNQNKSIENPERRHIELMEQQRKSSYKETTDKKEDFKYETITDNYKRKKE